MARAGSCHAPVVHLFKEEKKGIISGWEAFFQLPGLCHVSTLGRRTCSTESRCKRVSTFDYSSWEQQGILIHSSSESIATIALTLTDHFLENKVSLWKSSVLLVVESLSHVWLFATPWPVAHQAPLSMGFFSEHMFISFFRHSTCQSDRAHITLLFSLSPLRILISHPQNSSGKKNLNTGEINPRKSI